MLEADRQAPRKQRQTAHRIWNRLRKEHPELPVSIEALSHRLIASSATPPAHLPRLARCRFFKEVSQTLMDAVHGWLLLDKGANVNTRVCGVKSTADACVGDTTETRTNFTMQWLLEDGATPFLRAAQSGDVILMKLLLSHGADPKTICGTPAVTAYGCSS